MKGFLDINGLLRLVAPEEESLSDPLKLREVVLNPPAAGANEVADLTGWNDDGVKLTALYSLRQKTAAELLVDSDRLANAAALAAYTGLSNSTGTIAERLVRIEKTLAAVVRKVFL